MCHHRRMAAETTNTPRTAYPAARAAYPGDRTPWYAARCPCLAAASCRCRFAASRVRQCAGMIALALRLAAGDVDVRRAGYAALVELYLGARVDRLAAEDGGRCLS